MTNKFRFTLTLVVLFMAACSGQGAQGPSVSPVPVPAVSTNVEPQKTPTVQVPFGPELPATQTVCTPPDSFVNPLSQTVVVIWYPWSGQPVKFQAGAVTFFIRINEPGALDISTDPPTSGGFDIQRFVEGMLYDFSGRTHHYVFVCVNQLSGFLDRQVIPSADQQG